MERFRGCWMFFMEVGTMDSNKEPCLLRKYLANLKCNRNLKWFVNSHDILTYSPMSSIFSCDCCSLSLSRARVGGLCVLFSSFSSTPFCFWSPVDGGGSRPTSVCACSCSSADLPDPCHCFYRRKLFKSVCSFIAGVQFICCDWSSSRLGWGRLFLHRFCSADRPPFSRWGLVTTLTTPGKRTLHIIISYYLRVKSH